MYNVHSVYVDCGCLYVCTLYVSASTSVTGPVVTSLKSFLGMLPLLPFFLWNFICFVLKRNRAVPIQIIDKMQALRLIENSMVKRLNLSNTWSGEEQYQSVQFTSVSQLRLFAKGTTPFRFAAYVFAQDCWKIWGGNLPKIAAWQHKFPGQKVTVCCGVCLITYTSDTYEYDRVSLNKDCGASYKEMKGMIYWRKEKNSQKLLAFLKH